MAMSKILYLILSSSVISYNRPKAKIIYPTFQSIFKY